MRATTDDIYSSIDCVAGKRTTRSALDPGERPLHKCCYLNVYEMCASFLDFKKGKHGVKSARQGCICMGANSRNAITRHERGCSSSSFDGVGGREGVTNIG